MTTLADTVPPRHRWILPVVVLLGLSLCALALYLGSELLEGEHFGFDPAILLALRKAGYPDVPIGPAWLTQSAIDISALGGFTIMWLFGGAALWALVRVRRRLEAAWFASALVGASLLNVLLKSWLHRPRPELVPHLAQVANASFPSGHAMISAATYLTLAFMVGEVWPGLRRAAVSAAVVLVVMIGASRVYLGVHWPSDVLAGWSLGSAWALAALALRRWSRRPRELA